MSMELSSQRLQEYLRQVIDLEVQCRTADKAYNNYKTKASQLAVPRRSAPIGNKPTGKETSMRSATLRGLLSGSIGFVISTAVGTGLSLLLRFLSSKDGFLSIIAGFLYMLGGKWILPLAGVLIGLWFIWAMIGSTRDYIKKENKEVSSAKLEYECQLEAYQKDQARVKQEMALVPTLQKDIALFDERRRKSAELLDKYYALDVVKPKYRNLLCVATFLEYLENERCYTLTGPDGCYNKFEEERRQGIIIAQLTNISRQLEQIRQNQERVADALTTIQQNTNYLCAGLQQVNEKLDVIQQDTRTAAWYSQQAAEDQRAMNNYVMMRDWINS